MFCILIVSGLNVSTLWLFLISSALTACSEVHSGSPRKSCDCTCQTPGGAIELSFSFPETEGGRGEEREDYVAI